jgi:hypothetical protein
MIKIERKVCVNETFKKLSFEQSGKLGNLHHSLQIKSNLIKLEQDFSCAQNLLQPTTPGM